MTTVADIEPRGAFLFSEGRYVDAPYKVTQEWDKDVLWFLVNGRRFDWIRRYPKDYVDSVEPMPADYTEDTTFEKLEAAAPQGEAWHYRKARWLSSHFPLEEAHARMIEMYRSLPFVEKVVTDTDPVLLCPRYTVIPREGKKRQFVPDNRSLLPLPEAAFQRLVAGRIEHWEEMLHSPGVIIRPRGGEIVTGTAKLPEIVDVLQSQDTPEKKAEKLAPLMFPANPDPIDLKSYLGEFLVDFKGSPQLDARIRKLREERREREHDGASLQRPRDHARLLAAAPPPPVPKQPVTDVDPHVERFGQRAVPEFKSDSTVFFLNGRYVASPYRLERRGLKVLLNGRLVMKCKWPSSWEVEDPPLPSGLTPDSELKDLRDCLPGGRSWYGHKVWYLKTQYPPREAVALWKAAVEALPMVKTVEFRPEPRSNRAWVHITSFKGEKITNLMIDYDDDRRTPQEITQQYIDSMEQKLRHLEQVLKGGGFRYCLPGYEYGFSAGDPIWERLPEFVDAADSDLPRAEKVARMRELLMPLHEKQIAERRLSPMLQNFKRHPQLDARMEAIRNQRRK